jgi:hypothetical protein
MAAAFQLYRKSQTFWSDDGTLLAGGKLKFFTAGTSTPKHVYGEKALTTDNGTEIMLDASGRPEWAIWGSGQYDVEIYDADDEQVGEDLMVEVSGGEATALPALVTDKFLTNDGDVMSWAAIKQLPSMTDHSGDYLSTDGTTATWVAGPETPTVPDLPITVTTGTNGGVVFGATGSDFVQQLWGSDSVAGGGGLSVADSVTFSTAFKTAPKVFVQCTGTPGTTSGDVHLRCSVTPSTTGFSVTFSTKTGGTSADSSGTDSKISGTVNYSWLAVGTINEP